MERISGTQEFKASSGNIDSKVQNKTKGMNPCQIPEHSASLKRDPCGEAGEEAEALPGSRWTGGQEAILLHATQLKLAQSHHFSSVLSALLGSPAFSRAVGGPGFFPEQIAGLGSGARRY